MSIKRPLLLLVLLLATACGKKPDPGKPTNSESGPNSGVVDGNLCGNRVLDKGELCDFKIAVGEPGACPTLTACTSQTPTDPCNAFELQGSGCQQKCVEVPKITACANGDGCCPSGCTPANDDSCTASGNPTLCGNRGKDLGELCDTGIATGQAGACPTAAECAAKTATSSCKKVELSGTGCMQECVEVDKTTSCVGGDGCCPSGCTAATDTDCPTTPPPPLCGNRTRDPGESCDTSIPHGQVGSCKTPADCAAMPKPADQCKEIVHTGLGCDQKCEEVDKTTSCTDNDGCCPAGCDPTTDNDCKATEVKLGADCDAFHTCESGTTCTQFPNQTNTVCAIECTTAPGSCPSGSVCEFVDASRKFCLVDCTSDPSLCKTQKGATCTNIHRDSTIPATTQLCYAARIVDSNIGEKCTSSTACGFDGICQEEDSTAYYPYKEGECYADCSRDTCPSGSKCARGTRGGKTSDFCYKECDPTDATSCRDGYFCLSPQNICLPLPSGVTTCKNDSECTPPDTCADPDGKGYKVCQNVGGNAVGEDCQQESDCKGIGPLCEDYDTHRGKKQCSIDCAKGSQVCPSGTICITYGTSGIARCRPDCRTNSAVCDDTRGFQCEKISGSPVYCAYHNPVAKIHNYGGACTTDSDCQTSSELDGICLGGSSPVKLKGGYCSADCSKFSCPSDSVCLTYTIGTDKYHHCIKSCSVDTDCGRSDYECKHATTYSYCGPK